MRFLFKVLGFTLVVAFSLLASVLFHLDTPLGRDLGRDILNDYVSGEMAGTLEAGQIVQLRLWHSIVKNTYVYDPDGTKIIYGETVELAIDPLAALLGKLRFSWADLNGGWVKLIDNGDGEPTFLDAFGPADPTPSEGEPLHAIVDNMDLRDIDVQGELLGLKDIRIIGMNAKGRMEFRHESDFQVDSATGELVEPFPFRAKLENLEASIRTDMAGTYLRAEASKGSEYLTAYLKYKPPTGGTIDDPYVLDMRLLPKGIEAQTLRDVGWEWAESLKGTVDGELRMHQPKTVLFIDAELNTAAGPVTVAGKFPPVGPEEVTIRAKSAQVDAVLDGFPEVKIGGAVTLRTDPVRETTIVELDTNPFEYEGYELPSLKGRATLGEEGLRINRVSGPYAGGDITVSGTVDYVGGSDVRIRGRIPEVSKDPNFQQFVPDLRGSAELDVRLKQFLNGRIDARGWVALDDVHYGAIKADVSQISGRVSGDPTRPRIDLDFEGGNVRVAGYPVGHGEVTVKGGPTLYDAEGSFRAKGNRRAEFKSQVQLDRGRYIVDAEHLELTVGDLVWQGTLQEVVLDPDESLSFERVRMGNGNQKLEAKGIWRFNGPDNIRLDLDNYDLGALPIVFPEDSPEVSGRADLHFEFEGDIDRRPKVRAEGTFTEAALWGISPVTAAYLLTYDEGDLDLDAQVSLSRRGSFSLSASGLLEPEMTDPIKNLREGVYDVSVVATGLDLTLAERWLPDDAPDFDGFADARLRLEGPIDAPTFRGNVQVPALRYEDWSSLDVKTEFRYDYGSLVARVQAADPKGELAEAEGSLLIDVVNLMNNFGETISTLETSPWRLSLRIPPRSLDALPKSMKRDLTDTAKNMRVSASATLAGGGFRTRGDLHASLDWRSDFGGELCATSARPRATIKAHLEDNKTEVSMDGLIGKRRVIRVDASAPTPIDDWLSEAVKPERPITTLRASIINAPTEDIPYLCRYAAGPLSGQLDVADLFGDAPLFNLAIQSDELRARRLEPAIKAGTASTIVETPPASVGVTATYKEGLGNLDANVRWWNGGASNISAKLPLAWSKTEYVPTLADAGELDADAHFDRMPLQAALAWMSGIISAEGMLDGNVSARGNVEKPALVGNVELSDGRVDLRNIGQTLRDVSGLILFDEDGIFLKDVKAKDARGQAEVNGQLVLDGFRPTSASMRLKAKNFPVRQEGTIIAAVDGSASIRSTFEEDGLKGDVRVSDLEVEVPDNSLTPQDLAVHPEVYFVGEEPKPDEITGYRFDLNIDATRPFRVASREQGFAARVTAKIAASYDSKVFLVNGPVALLPGGFFEVFGKRFDVRSGSLVFEGRPEMNPKVDLVAVYKPRGTNDSVTVTAFGRLDNPNVEFNCSVTTESEAQCISFLLTGRTSVERGSQVSSEAAGAEATEFLSGVATGVIASGLKSEFGGFAPTIGLRGGANTTGEATDTQLLIGFDVGSLIPERFRSVIQGLYVEGQFIARRQAGGQDSTGQAQRPGFLIEALWPKRFVTTGAAAPPSNWSFDVTWEP